MDTKWFTKHWNYEIVRKTRLHTNLLTDWHDGLVGISPCTTQPITTNRRRRSEWPFFLSGVYSEFIPPIIPGSDSEDNQRFTVAKMLLFLVPGIT